MKSLLPLLSLFCLVLVSCSKETAQPVEPVIPDTTVAEPLSITRIDGTTANVSWTEAVPGAASVVLEWEPAGNPVAVDTAHLAGTATSSTVTGLDSTLDYTMLLTTRKSDGDVILRRGSLSRAPLLPPPDNASGLQAASLSMTSVGLQWTPSTTAGATYLVTYRKVGTTGSADTAASATAGSPITISGNSATVTGLTVGAYTFHVYAMRSGLLSSGTSLVWAPATRFTHDAANPSVPLRMYEFRSLNGAGLIIDPAKGGPRNASLSASSPDPAGSISLAIFTEVPVPWTFDIGPAYAFLGFRNANKFDSSAYISRNGYSVSSLDDLHLSNNLDSYITSGGDQAGNISAFNLPATTPDGKGVAFILRIGNGPNTHYARVLVKADDTGRLLRGTSPNRYVEVEISYQMVANLPFAKRAGRSDSRPDYTSYIPVRR